jgi:hypothetical protein
MAGHGWQVALEGAISKRAAQTSLAQGNLPQARAPRLSPSPPPGCRWLAGAGAGHPPTPRVRTSTQPHTHVAACSALARTARRRRRPR